MPLSAEDLAKTRAAFVAIRGEKAALDFERVYSGASLYLAFREAIRDHEPAHSNAPQITQDFQSFAASASADIYKKANLRKAAPAKVMRVDQD